MLACITLLFFPGMKMIQLMAISLQYSFISLLILVLQGCVLTETLNIVKRVVFPIDVETQNT